MLSSFGSRSKFQGWDDIVPFDFTRTADSVQRRGADLKVLLFFAGFLKIKTFLGLFFRFFRFFCLRDYFEVIMERDKIKADLSSLFLPRQSSMNEEEANQVMEECNEDLQLLEPFVLVIICSVETISFVLF